MRPRGLAHQDVAHPAQSLPGSIVVASVDYAAQHLHGLFQIPGADEEHGVDLIGLPIFRGELGPEAHCLEAAFRISRGQRDLNRPLRRLRLRTFLRHFQVVAKGERQITLPAGELRHQKTIQHVPGKGGVVVCGLSGLADRRVGTHTVFGGHCCTTAQQRPRQQEGEPCRTRQGKLSGIGTIAIEGHGGETWCWGGCALGIGRRNGQARCDELRTIARAVRSE